MIYRNLFLALDHPYQFSAFKIPQLQNRCSYLSYSFSAIIPLFLPPLLIIEHFGVHIVCNFIECIISIALSK